jgi:rhodanese-related sulfurtransferase
MIQFIKNILGMGPSTDWQELIGKGAQIVDVRTTAEYSGGHIKGSKNIPLQILPAKLNGLRKDKPVITCCASGMRSASAKSILISAGFQEVHNGGSWSGLQNRIS